MSNNQVKAWDEFQKLVSETIQHQKNHLKLLGNFRLYQMMTELTEYNNIVASYCRRIQSILTLSMLCYYGHQSRQINSWQK